MLKPLLLLDFTQISVVVCCRACDHWRAFAFTRLEGWKSAAAHEERCHPGSHHARDAYAHALKAAGHAVTADSFSAL